MNQKHIFLTLLFTLLAVLVVGCGQDSSQEEQPVDIPPVIETSKVVSAEAFVVPIEEVDIAFETGGRVIEVLVEEGDQIEAGQVLARLKDTNVKAAIAVAEANLAQAKANLEQTKVGPTAEQIAVAEAAVTRAEANLAQVVAGATPEEIAVAEARVNTLKSQLAQTTAGARNEDVRVALTSLRKAENAVTLAQTDYDQIAHAADAEYAQPITLALQDATLSYEAALANYEALVNGATVEQIAVAETQVAEGEASLAQLLAGATAEQIALAQVAILEAEAALAQTKVGPTLEQIAVAEAGVEQAEAALAQTRLGLDDLEITAPFAGTVTNANLEVGEIVSPGAPVIKLADLSTLQVETDDLTEIDVVKVIEGKEVEIRADALPGETFKGTVTRIKPQSETKAGDVTYTVVIDFVGDVDPRLRWGMTTFVEILAE
jgi:HlyD family secretion protein